MLNIFNRIATVVGLLSIIGIAMFCAVGLYLPPALYDRVAASSAAQLAALATMPPEQRALITGIAVFVILVTFFLLVLELRPPEKEEAVYLKGPDGAETVIARGAILQRLEFAVDRLEDVVQTEPRLEGQADGMIVHLDVTTTPYIDVPMKTEEIRAVTREVIEKQMGLVLRKVTVKIDHEKFRELVAEEEV